MTNTDFLNFFFAHATQVEADFIKFCIQKNGPLTVTIQKDKKMNLDSFNPYFRSPVYIELKNFTKNLSLFFKNPSFEAYIKYF